MKRRLSRSPVQRLLWGAMLLAVWLLCSGQAAADSLGERLAAFPDWSTKPAVQPSTGDLVYPDWFEGRWQLTSTLVEMTAPLAPELMTPGFEGNRQFLNVPVTAEIRFRRARVAGGRFLNRTLNTSLGVVSDRAFNGLSLGRAYLGEDWVRSVQTDPDDPNRQVTLLKDNQQLVSTVTGRRTERPDEGSFITTELFQQFFRGARPSVYLNEVENTTAYRRQPDGLSADQVTAIYLSPKDPDYFKAVDRPVALYRYRLTLLPLPAAG